MRLGTSLGYLRQKAQTAIASPAAENSALVRQGLEAVQNLNATVASVEYQVFVPGVDNPDDTVVTRVVL
jgi:hypothetical protein